jgi:protein involved in polysaccharide export with SLBB domain
VTVEEHATVNVAVIGAVNQPGTHALPATSMRCSGALMAAGGIKTERGARDIRSSARRAGPAVEHALTCSSTTSARGRGAQAAARRSWSSRARARLHRLGLVKRTGIFAYPPPRRFNLMQALATAGGVDENAAPRYATIYRSAPTARCWARPSRSTARRSRTRSNILIKDGDVIAVDHTQGSWLRQFFSQVFGFRPRST